MIRFGLSQVKEEAAKLVSAATALFLEGAAAGALQVTLRDKRRPVSLGVTLSLKDGTISDAERRRTASV